MITILKTQDMNYLREIKQVNQKVSRKVVISRKNAQIALNRKSSI